MFDRFLVATDLSAASFAVVNGLSGLKAYGAKQCLLLQCLDAQEAISTALSYSTAPLDAVLAQQKASLEKQGFVVETRIVPGFARTEINRIAVEEDYSLIVVGAQGHSMLGEALLGGVAHAVILTARKPVLVVRVERTPDGGVRPAHCDFVGHVLFPTDFSDNADHAFTYVEKLAADGARHVTLLNVQDARVEEGGAELDAIHRQRLETLAGRLRESAKTEVDIDLAIGSAAHEILRVIRERDVDLVVMGSQGRGFVKESLLGSVSHDIARHAPVSVLLVPAPRR